MKKQAINYSWPVVLSGFSQDSVQENFSRGKLSVFFKGETPDHRYFSDEFAENLVLSLPYTPIVSSYDEEKQDFVGHAAEQQIFGIVDPCVEPKFEVDEEGIEWCICDVVLYTERPDTVGKLAQQIVGHSQSLELDPSSVQYKINYDEKKHFKNIEFTAGKFVGVSVLGKDQKPAFTGSAFFNYNEQFENKMNILREYCESKKDQTQNGGETMDLQEFMKLSWGDISVKVGAAISKEYANDAYTEIIDMFEDKAVVRFYYYVEDVCKLMRINYTCGEDGEITLGEVHEVRITYEDVKTDDQNAEINMGQVEEDSTDAVSEAISETNAENDEKFTEDKQSSDDLAGTSTEEETIEIENCEETQTVVEEDSVEEEKPVEEAVEEVIADSEVQSDPAQVSDVEITPATETKASVEDETSNDEETNTGSASFTDSEREELETLKREKKVRLVDSFKENLSDKEYADFIELANSDIAEEKLELDLLKAYKRNLEEEESHAKPIRAFAFAPVQDAQPEDALDVFVRKNRR